MDVWWMREMRVDLEEDMRNGADLFLFEWWRLGEDVE
jgi:hypothetical protein